jgi:hypothetical protein
MREKDQHPPEKLQTFRISGCTTKDGTPSGGSGLPGGGEAAISSV